MLTRWQGQFALRSPFRKVTLVVRVVAAGFFLLVAVVTPLDNVAGYDPPEPSCGGNAIAILTGGGDPPPGHDADCNESAFDSLFGGLLSLVVATAFVFSPWALRTIRKTRQLAPSPIEAAPEVTVPQRRPLRVVRASVRPPATGPGLKMVGFVVAGLVMLAIAAPIVSSGSASGAPISTAGAMQFVFFAGVVCAVTCPLIERQWRDRALPIRTTFAVVPAVLGFLLAPLSVSAAVYFVGAFIAGVLLVPVALVRETVTPLA